MTINDLKSQIDSGVISDSLIIFECGKSGEPFLAHQYIHEISRLKNLPISPLMDLNDVLEEESDSDLFDITPQETLKVYICDKLDCSDNRLLQKNNLVVVVYDKIDGTAKTLFSSCIISLPACEEWQVKDYLYSNMPNISTKNLDWLQKACGNNLYKLTNEMEKLMLFHDCNLDEVFKYFYFDGVYSDIINRTVMDLIKAVQTRDVTEIRKCYANIPDIEDADMLILNLLTSSFRNIMLVHFGDASPESTGLQPKQIYAISKTPNKYTEAQVANIYVILTDIPRLVRIGELPTGKFLVDYMLTKILTA